jgi:signal transduction histidine kinase
MVGVTVVAVVLFGVPLGVAAGRLYRQQEVIRLERAATQAAGAVPIAGLGQGDPIELPRTGPAVGLYDKGLRKVAGRGPRSGGAVVAGAVAGRVTQLRSGADLAVAVPLHGDEAVIGAARASVAWSTVARRQELTWLAMSVLGALAVGVAAALARRQARRLAAPIGELATMAERLGHGDFSARLARRGIDEVDRAVDSLNATAARLGELVSRERAFSSDASHQLRTPLTSLRLGLESALLAPGPDSQAAIRDAVDEVERLETTVSALLAIARDAPSEHVNCDVTAVCEAAVARCRGGLAKVGRRLELDLEPGLSAARCSPGALAEILQVLLENARTHGRGTVWLRGRRAGSGVVIEVDDEGDGVDGDVERVFRRRDPAAAGHGIGLALARSLAEGHDGRLLLRSPGPHPVFAVVLPGATA